MPESTSPESMPPVNKHSLKVTDLHLRPTLLHTPAYCDRYEATPRAFSNWSASLANSALTYFNHYKPNGCPVYHPFTTLHFPFLLPAIKNMRLGSLQKPFSLLKLYKKNKMYNGQTQAHFGMQEKGTCLARQLKVTICSDFRIEQFLS